MGPEGCWLLGRLGGQRAQRVVFQPRPQCPWSPRGWSVWPWPILPPLVASGSFVRTWGIVGLWRGDVWVTASVVTGVDLALSLSPSC